MCELKVVQYEKYLQKRAMNEAEARNLLYKYQAESVFSDSEDSIEEDTGDINEVKVSNVVEENIRIKGEVKEAHKEITRL